MWGGLIFIGAVISIIFTIATVLTIYYKQISEGNEDKRNFKILRQLGIDEKTVNKTIRLQVLLTFFLPITFAIIHCYFASPALLNLMEVFFIKNDTIFIKSLLFTGLGFFIIYTLTYFVTSKVYYKIISSES